VTLDAQHAGSADNSLDGLVHQMGEIGSSYRRRWRHADRNIAVSNRQVNPASAAAFP
jgi:hypothetical protein